MGTGIYEEIRRLLDGNRIDEAIAELDSEIASREEPDDTLFYLRGNAFRKKSDWQQAINNYLQAIAVNPDSPARGACEILNDIMNFYHKDLYNP